MTRIGKPLPPIELTLIPIWRWTPCPRRSALVEAWRADRRWCVWAALPLVHGSLASATARYHEAGHQSRPHHSIGHVCSSPLPEMHPVTISVGLLVLHCRPLEKQLASSHAAFHLRGVLGQHPSPRNTTSIRPKAQTRLNWPAGRPSTTSVLILTKKNIVCTVLAQLYCCRERDEDWKNGEKNREGKGGGTSRGTAGAGECISGRSEGGDERHLWMAATSGKVTRQLGSMETWPHGGSPGALLDGGGELLTVGHRAPCISPIRPGRDEPEPPTVRLELPRRSEGGITERSVRSSFTSQIKRN
jgi:hypothetical protein